MQTGLSDYAVNSRKERSYQIELRTQSSFHHYLPGCLPFVGYLRYFSLGIHVKMPLELSSNNSYSFLPPLYPRRRNTWSTTCVSVSSIKSAGDWRYDAQQAKVLHRSIRNVSENGIYVLTTDQ